MRREIKDIIENDVVIPDIVLKAKEEAFAKIPDVDGLPEETEVSRVKTGKGFRKKWVAVAAVAVLAVGTLSVSAATGVFDGALARFMNIDSENLSTLNLAQKEDFVSVTAECIDYTDNPEGEKKDITVTVSEIIGDSTSAYVRFDFDYELPEGFDPEEWFIVDEYTSECYFYNDSALTERADNPKDVSGIWNYDNGKFSMLYRFVDLEDISSKYLNICFNNLMMFPNDQSVEPILLCQGVWNLVVPMDYEVQEPIVLDPDVTIIAEDAEFEKTDGTMDIRDTEIKITEITISPLVISIDGEADFNPEEEKDLFMQYSIDKITFKDGTVLEYDYTGFKNALSDYKYNAVFQSYQNSSKVFSYNNVGDMFGSGINLDKLESITINGEEIKIK